MFPEAKPRGREAKLEKTAKKSFSLRRLAHNFAAVQGARPDHVRVQSSCCLLLGVSEF